MTNSVSSLCQFLLEKETQPESFSSLPTPFCCGIHHDHNTELKPTQLWGWSWDSECDTRTHGPVRASVKELLPSQLSDFLKQSLLLSLFPSWPQVTSAWDFGSSGNCSYLAQPYVMHLASEEYVPLSPLQRSLRLPHSRWESAVLGEKRLFNQFTNGHVLSWATQVTAGLPRLIIDSWLRITPGSVSNNKKGCRWWQNIPEDQRKQSACIIAYTGKWINIAVEFWSVVHCNK